jgi:hypothetical protein
VKVGKQVGGDVAKILRDFGNIEMPIHGRLELGRFLKQRGLIDNGGIGLQAMVGYVLRRFLPKDDAIRIGNWEAFCQQETVSATDEMGIYAAKDVDASRQVFEKGSSHPLVGIPLENPNNGDPVTLLSPDQRKKIADGTFLSLDGETATISITDVLVPNAKTSTHSNAETLKTLSNGIIPFDLSIPLDLLRTRAPFEKPKVNLNPLQNLQPVTATTVVLDEDTTVDSVQDIDFSDENMVDLAVTGLLEDRSPTGEVDNESLNFGEIVLTEVDQAPVMTEADKTLHSRVLGDVFHLLKYPRISKTHSLYHDFAIAYSNAVLVRVKEPKENLKRAFVRLGLDFDDMLKSHRKSVLKCCPAVIPAGQIVASSAKEVFQAYGPRKCSKTGLPLFNKTVWKQVAAQYKALKNGLYSDPPDVQLYREMGIHKTWGVPMYHTGRGTNSNEGTGHSSLVHTFNSFNCGPMFFCSILWQYAIRGNLKVK